MSRSRDRDRERAPGRASAQGAGRAGTPGKRTLVEHQRGPDALAARGTSGAGGGLPHLDAIQAAFGHHDLGDLVAHDGEEAATAATALGTTAFAYGDRVAFATAPDLHAAAHEAAHVIQQRAGVASHGEPGDAHEQHANAVADRVVRGESAEALLDQATGGGGAARAVVQRFEPPEHARMGVDVMVELAPGYRISSQEMVAMGDYFESIDQMRAFARNTHGIGSREEIEYVREVGIGGRNQAAWAADPKKYVAEAVENRALRLAGTNARHFPSANGESAVLGLADRAASAPDPADDARVGDLHVPPELGNAVHAYRYYHLRALAEAAAAAAKGLPVDSALATEGFGAHFLSDSFAAGHVRTQRQSIKAFWNAKVPLFFLHLKGWIAEAIAVAYDAPTAFALGPAREVVNAKLDAAGELGFGDLVSGALHDYDNLEGMRATSDGRSVVLHGDGHAGAGGGDGDYVDEEILGRRAVQLGYEEVRQAWQLGLHRSPREVATVLRGGDGLYAGERLIPRARPDTAQIAPHRTPAWGFQNVEDLLGDPQFARGAAVFAQEKANTILAAVAGDAKKEAAVRKGVVEPLVGRTIPTLRAIIHWIPGFESGQSYVETIRAIPGGTASLAMAERTRLLESVLTISSANKAQPLFELLATAPDEDARALIRKHGWDRFWSHIDHWAKDGPFSRRFPAKTYAERMMPGYPQ